MNHGKLLVDDHTSGAGHITDVIKWFAGFRDLQAYTPPVFCFVHVNVSQCRSICVNSSRLKMRDRKLNDHNAHGGKLTTIRKQHRDVEVLFVIIALKKLVRMHFSSYKLQRQYNTIPHHTTQPFYGPFSETTGLSRCQKRTSGLYGARED